MKQRILPALAALFLFVASPLHAQRIDSPYRFLDHGQHVGLFGGYIAADEGVLGIGPEAGPALGARWALRVSGPFSVGAEVAFMPTKRTVRDTVFVAADSMFRSIGEADMSLLTVMGNLRVNLTGARTWNSIQPFVLLGAGVALNLAGETAQEAELDPTQRFDFGTSFAGQFGAGADWFPTSRVSLSLDARNMLWKLNAPDAFRLTENGRRFAGSEWEQNLAVTVGLSFHF
jgi:hypothetical protein